MTSREELIIFSYLKFMHHHTGLTHKEIGEAVGVTKQTIWNLFKNPMRNKALLVCVIRYLELRDALPSYTEIAEQCFDAHSERLRTNYVEHQRLES